LQEGAHIAKHTLFRHAAKRAARDDHAERRDRYFGTVTLDASRVGRDAGRIAEEVIAHLSGLVGARVTVTLEIGPSRVPIGQPDTNSSAPSVA
jgi:hypothetical protein